MRCSLTAFLGVLLLSPVAAHAQGAVADEVIPAHILRFAEKVRTELLDTLDVASLLRPACPRTVARMRAAQDWELNDALVALLPDDELCDLTVALATVLVEWSVALYSEIPAERLDEAHGQTDSDLDEAAARLLGRLFPGHRFKVQGDFDVRDDSGAAVWPPTSREEVTHFLALMKDFRSLKAQGVTWKTPTLQANIEYFQRIHSQSGVGKFDDAYIDCWLSFCVVIEDHDHTLAVVELMPFSQ